MLLCCKRMWACLTLGLTGKVDRLAALTAAHEAAEKKLTVTSPVQPLRDLMPCARKQRSRQT